MDKFVVRTPRSEKMPPPSPQPVKAFKQLTLEGLKGVVVLEELERAKLALRRRDASPHDKLRQLRLLAQKTPTAAILQSSGIGAAVSAARNDPDASVAAEAKRVHRAWKAHNSSKANRPSIEVRCDARTQRLRDSARAMIKEALKSTLKAPQSSSCGDDFDSESLAGKINERHLSDIGAVVSTTSLGYSKGLRVDLDRYHCVMSSLQKEESDDDDDEEDVSSVEDNEEENGKEFTPVFRETIKKGTSTHSVASLDDTQQSSSMKKNASDVTASDSTRGKENLQHASSLSSKSQIIVPDDSRIEVDSNRSQSTEKNRDRQDDIEAKYAIKYKKHKRTENHTRPTRNDNGVQKLDESDKRTKSEDKQSETRSVREKESRERKREDKIKENDHKKGEVKDMKSKDRSLLEGHGNSKNKLKVGEKSKKPRSREEGCASLNRSSEKKCHCDLSSDKPSGKPALRLDDRRVLNNKQCESIDGIENMSSDQHALDVTATKQDSSTKEGRTSTNGVSSSNNKRMRDGDSERGHCKKSKRDCDNSTLLDESGNKSVKKVVSDPERKSEKLEESSVDEPRQATNCDDHRNKNVAHFNKAADLVKSKCSNTGGEISKSESRTKSSCNCDAINAGRAKDSCACLTGIETQQILPKGYEVKNNKDPHILQSIRENKSFKDNSETPLTRVSTELGRHSSENVPPADRDHSQERRSSRDHKREKESRPSHKKKHSRKSDRERSDSKKCVTDPLTDGEKYDVLSEAIERELFSENNRLINKRYKKTIRRIVFTLKHQDRVRKKVLTGKYSAGRVLSKCWDE